MKEKNTVERFVAEGGGGKSTQGSGYTTTPGLLGQEEGNSGIMGGLTYYIQFMHKGDGLQGRGKSTGVMVDTLGSV